MQTALFKPSRRYQPQEDQYLLDRHRCAVNAMKKDFQKFGAAIKSLPFFLEGQLVITPEDGKRDNVIRAMVANCFYIKDRNHRYEVYKRGSICLRVYFDQKIIQIIKDCLKSLNATGFKYDRGYIKCVYWQNGYDFKNEAVTAKDVGEGYIAAKGNNRFKSGREFNQTVEQAIDQANKQLADYPDFNKYMFNFLGWKDRHIPIGAYLCRASFGFVNNEKSIVCRVPKEFFKDHDSGPKGWRAWDGKAYTIPETLKEITYGQFFDLTHKGEA